MTDNGGTRLGTDRRKHRYITYFQEKRSGRDRRKGFDAEAQSQDEEGSNLESV
jgi:hypothetical protein